jgi:diaminopimelate epimerase
MQFHFFKYQGAGNDFILIDNRIDAFDKSNHRLIEFLCHRRFGVGADGLMTLESESGYDFKMTYFNADGYEASMCGNGGRCIVAFAKKLGLIAERAFFMAADGPHHAKIEGEQVDLQMSDVKRIDTLADGYFLNTGVPHLVHFVEDLNLVDVNIEGRQLRYDSRFQPEGTNVNFVRKNGSNLMVYTYERGVESETLACGTGITASALSAAFREGLTSGKFDIQAKGGVLQVRWNSNASVYTDIWLKGPAKLVYEGEIDSTNFKEIG